MPLPNFTLRYSNGEPYRLNAYNNQVLLIVNTATGCGFRGQLEDLENLYETYRSQNFSVIAFPSNQFHQEKMSNSEMASMCHRNFGVTFPINEIIEVNGKYTEPVFQWLKQESPGLLSSSIKWNFTKFLINRQGQVVKRYGPMTSPRQIAKDIEELLLDAIK